MEIWLVGVTVQMTLDSWVGCRYRYDLHLLPDIIHVRYIHAEYMQTIFLLPNILVELQLETRC